MPFFLRRAEILDCELLDSFYATMGRKESGYFLRCLEEQTQGRRDVVLGFVNGQESSERTLGGYVMLNYAPAYTLYARLNIPEIQDLNVGPSFRRRGLGSALIAHCEDLARVRGAQSIGISVGLGRDYGSAQRLYVKRGYVPDGHGVTYDRVPVAFGEIRPIDDDLCLMMIKTFVAE